MPHVETGDGTRLHYEVEGREDGPPLLFSNSLGTNLHMWDAQAAEAAGLGFRVIRYDQRGHGGSDVPAGEYSIERLAQDVIDLLAALSVDRTAFCGISMGAMTGLHLAMQRPALLSRAALCNIAAWMPPRDMWDGRIRDVGAGGMPAIVDAILDRGLSKATRRDAPDTVARLRDTILATDPAGYAGCCAALRDMDLRDHLQLIETPVFVVIGAQDVSTPPERGRYIVENVPGAQDVVLDAAHLSNLDAPEDFNHHVFAFLTGHRP